MDSHTTLTPPDEPDPFADKPPETLQEYFVVQLRRLRRERGLSQTQLAERINYSPGLVSMVETLQRRPTPDFTTRCDTALHTGGTLAALLPLMDREASPSWFRSFIALEAEAVMIESFELQTVPGLFQTESYARAILKSDWPPHSPDDLEQLLQRRLERQHILRREQPPLVWMVIDESVLLRRIGTNAVMVEQLDHLVRLTARPHIQLQVMPMFCAGRAPLEGPFVLLELPQEERVAYMEVPGSGQILPDQRYVQRCARTIDVMRSEALSLADSANLIQHIKEALYDRE